MAEQKRPVQPVRVSYACDQCGGDVLPTGMCLTSCPAQYPHDCQQCGERYTFTSLYPRVEYVGTPTDCDALSRPPTFQERHDANVATLAEIHDMVWGDAK